MKRILTRNSLLFLAAILTQLVNAQTSPAPGVKWRTYDWATLEATTGIPQSASESGEDWWYDHKNVFDASGNHTGYIAAGFAQGLNRDDDFDLDEGGCYSCNVQKHIGVFRSTKLFQIREIRSNK